MDDGEIEEDDWDEVDDGTNQGPGDQGLTVTIEPQTGDDTQVDVMSMGYYQEIPSGEGMPNVQIEAPNFVYQDPNEIPAAAAQVEEEAQVDESYDPTADFLSDLQGQGQSQGQPEPVSYDPNDVSGNVVEATIDIPADLTAGLSADEVQQQQEVQQPSGGPVQDVLAQAVSSHPCIKTQYHCFYLFPFRFQASGVVDVINDDLDISDSDEDETPAPPASDQAGSAGDDPGAAVPPAAENQQQQQPPPADDDGLWF